MMVINTRYRVGLNYFDDIFIAKNQVKDPFIFIQYVIKLQEATYGHVV